MQHSAWILMHLVYGLALGAFVHVSTWLMTRGLHWTEKAISKGDL